MKSDLSSNEKRLLMQLSLNSDYSLRVLIYLALKDHEKASIEEIADAYQISIHHLVKVVHRLGKLGYIKTSRGRGGGLKLAKDPFEIRLGEVIKRTEKLILVECFEGGTTRCPIAGSCGLQGVLKQALQAFIETLNSFTLAGIIADSKNLRSILKIS
jgi:Rrf2 family nitric oxide-sensitive transcriptional repressor